MLRCRSAVGCALLLLAAACGDSTGVDEVSVTIDLIQVEGPVMTDLPDGGAEIACAVDLRAQAVGTGTAAWLGGTLRYYAGVTGQAPIDSVTLPAADVHAAWGAPDIAGDSSQLSGWTFVAPFPFAVEFELAYRSEGSQATRSATVDFACGPLVPPGTSPPSLQSMLVVPTDGVLSVGGGIDVSFQAFSPVGIWQSMVEVSGACELRQLFPERLQMSVSRAVHLTLPSECPPGESVVVTAYVLDGGLRETGRAAAAMPIVDVSPPTLSPTLDSRTPASVTTPLAGTFFHGDTIDVNFSATDDYRVAWLIWEAVPFGVRDSVAVPSSGPEPKVRIPVPASWSGPFTLDLTVRDFAGLQATERSAPGAMRILPSVSPVGLTDTIAWNVTDLAIDAPRQRIYVLQSLPDEIAVLSLTTLERIATLSLGALPNAMDMTPGGDSLLVTLASRQTLGVVDLRQATLALTEIPLALDPALGQQPDGVAAMASGKVLITLRSFQGLIGNRLHEVDLGTGVQRGRPDVSSDGLLRGLGIERSADGTRAGLQADYGMRLYDGVSDTFGADVAPTYTGPGISLNAAGTLISMGLSLYDGSTVLQRQADLPVPAPSYSTSSQLSPSGARLMHAWPNIGLLQSTTSDGQILHRLRVPGPIGVVRFTPDGSALIIAGSLPGGQQTVITKIDLP
jgi:hypothetical protein